jgi:hypothetical protein
MNEGKTITNEKVKTLLTSDAQLEELRKTNFISNQILFRSRCYFPMFLMIK